MNKNTEYFLVLLLWLTTIYMWTLPIQKNPLPYGDVDPPVHYAPGDWMSENDKSVWKVPSYIELMYAKDTRGYVAYPPTFYSSHAVFQIIGGDRTKASYIFLAITSSMTLLSLYVLMRKFFGFIPAYLSSFLMAFSLRDILVYVMGQWMQAISFAFVPIIICFYFSYLESFFNKKRKDYYLYISILLLVLQYLFHPQGVVFSMAVMGLLTLVLWFKEKAFPLTTKNILLSIALFVVLIIALAPMQLSLVLGHAGIKQNGYSQSKMFKINNPGRLFYWSKMPDDNPGLPASYFSYRQMNGGIWTLILFFIGAAYLLFRKTRKDILLLVQVLLLYVFIHFDVISLPRYTRYLELEAQVFYPIAALGLVCLISLFKSTFLKKYAKPVLIAAFFFLALTVNAKNAYPVLRDAYPSMYRINPAQYDATQWIKKNLPEKAMVLPAGTLTYAKKKWLWTLSQRTFAAGNNFFSDDVPEFNLTDYVMVDYSDLYIVNRMDVVASLNDWETKVLAGSTKLFDKNNVRIYEVDKNWAKESFST
ncbi:hypothetical protein JXA85_04765 [Candidatus Woesearchaeota archaeon]|nr:hypothetical protein [Candidatus Woesearchaeota archaeon]